MPWISARLREPDGCPWDREQTHASLRNHLLEEAYEVYDALEGGATPELAGELGDLLLQVVLHAQLAAEAGRVRHDRRLDRARVEDRPPPPARVRRRRGAHRVRRQPPVGADQGGRARRGGRGRRRRRGRRRAAPKSALDGISRSLPALAASQEMQERAANLGYDWPSIDGVLDKVREEVGRARRGRGRDAHRAEELGDLLFVLVNVGRKTGIEVEGALRAANEKFRRRFRHVERAAAARRRRPARPVVRRAGCALGRREGGRARGGEVMSIGNQPPAATCARTGARPRTCARSRSRSGSRSGPRGRA